MKREWIRPATHAGMLAFVLLTPVLGKWGMAAFAFVAFLVNLLVLPRTAFGKSLARAGEGRWNGLLAYPLAVALGYALFEPVLASLAWTVMAIGDPAATVIGSCRSWKPRIPWNRTKSVAGSVAFVFAGTVGMLAVLFLEFPLKVEDLAYALCFATAAAALGALIESFPWPWDDNLPVLLGVGGGMTLLAAMS